MKIKAIKILGMILLLSMAIPAVYARGPTGKAGKSNVVHLYLVQKDPSSWNDIIEDGAWGKLTIKSKGDFVFNGHGLTPSKIYELINYVDDWPGVGSASFGTGTVDADGNVHIKGDAGEMTGVSGKIWLVLKDDFDTDRMVDWNPTAYLFEYDMI